MNHPYFCTNLEVCGRRLLKIPYLYQLISGNIYLRLTLHVEGDSLCLWMGKYHGRHNLLSVIDEDLYTTAIQDQSKLQIPCLRSRYQGGSLMNSRMAHITEPAVNGEKFILRTEIKGRILSVLFCKMQRELLKYLLWIRSR